MSEKLYPPSLLGCWLSALQTDRGAWVILSSCLLMIYGYILSNKHFLWRIILVNGISGFVGIVLQTTFLSVHVGSEQISPANENCNGYLMDARHGLRLLIGFNEISWFLFETSTVLYSFFKVETVTSVTLPPKVTLALRILTGIFVVAYVPLRINIGLLRNQREATWDADIESAHGYAFITWGLAEVVIFGMLIQAAIYARYERHDSTGTIASIVSTILSSSIFRLLIISTCQILIAAVSWINVDSGNTFRKNTWDILMIVRGVYPMIMMFDILSTQTLLVERIGLSNNDEHHERPHNERNVNVVETNNPRNNPAFRTIELQIIPKSALPSAVIVPPNRLKPNS